MGEVAPSRGRAVPSSSGHARVRAVDAIRASVLIAVMVGHWLAFALSEQDGQLNGQNLQQVWSPGDWLTWVFQVMPVFFLVGGFGNTASWTRRKPGVTALSWLGSRLWRLLLPTFVLLGTVTVAAMLLRLIEADQERFDEPLTMIGLPLWFLAVYVVAVSMTPGLVPAVQRHGLGVPAALLGSALAADVLFNHLGVPLVGFLNYAFFWVGVYSLGIAWRTGDLPGRRSVPVVLAVGGLISMVLLVWLGPYPVSMLAAHGEEVQNNGPPSAALVAMALAQTGVVLLVQPHLERWCTRPRIWAAVIWVNVFAMTLYLWHMVAGVLAAQLFWWFGWVQMAEPPTPTWWLWRPVWYAVCVLLLLLLVLVFGRFERRVVARVPGPEPSRARVVALVVGLVSVCTGMVQLTVTGLGTGPAGLPLLGLLAFGSGSALVAWSTGIASSAPAESPGAAG